MFKPIILAALTLMGLAAALALPASAEIICDEDGCKPAIILQDPLTSMLGDDD